jgi:hypothetical protein
MSRKGLPGRSDSFLAEIEPRIGVEEHSGAHDVLRNGTERGGLGGGIKREEGERFAYQDMEQRESFRLCKEGRRKTRGSERGLSYGVLAFVLLLLLLLVFCLVGDFCAQIISFHMKWPKPQHKKWNWSLESGIWNLQI